MIEEGFLSDEFVQRIPELSVFDIETLEVEGEEGHVHKLCSIAMSSEIDSESKYWVIDASDEEQRQTIGFNFFLVSFNFNLVDAFLDHLFKLSDDIALPDDYWYQHEKLSLKVKMHTGHQKTYVFSFSFQ